MLNSIHVTCRIVFTSLLLVLACNTAVLAATQQQQQIPENAGNELAPFAGLLENADNPVVTISTNKGDIVIELFAEEAPGSVRNFLQYVNSGYYTGTIFHRVIPDFMIQGGGFTESMQKKPGLAATIQNEADNGLKNKRGTPGHGTHPGSAFRYFAVFHQCQGTTASLISRRKAEAVGVTPFFGRVIQGMEIVEAIEGSKTITKSGYQDVPIQAVIMESVSQSR